MAFATANVKAGVDGNRKVLYGDWTGSAGDASGTMTVKTGRVYRAHFENQDADSPKEFVQTDISVSSGTATITIHNHMNVSQGRFEIVYA